MATAGVVAASGSCTAVAVGDEPPAASEAGMEIPSVTLRTAVQAVDDPRAAALVIAAVAEGRMAREAPRHAAAPLRLPLLLPPVPPSLLRPTFSPHLSVTLARSSRFAGTVAAVKAATPRTVSAAPIDADACNVAAAATEAEAAVAAESVGAPLVNGLSSAKRPPQPESTTGCGLGEEIDCGGREKQLRMGFDPCDTAAMTATPPAAASKVVGPRRDEVALLAVAMRSRSSSKPWPVGTHVQKCNRSDERSMKG
ncbi:hypothetical protein Vretifemale_15851 [Volvox reticuliferus]|uniref:Uncharacterized protein n=1 Tax=Volvox reticuliferus TaxID=1737510 RepID=A0A8J4FS12_9CHLO|nr:hypothetical protein Vretifemale_15851 [Volvox reticuliferus]